MTIYSFLSGVFRLLGLARWAAALWRAHVLAVKAQEVADAPSTRTELEDTLRKGEL